MAFIHAWACGHYGPLEQAANEHTLYVVDNTGKKWEIVDLFGALNRPPWRTLKWGLDSKGMTSCAMHQAL